MNRELQKLQGTWFIETLELEGNKMAGAAVAGAKIVVEGNRFTSLGMGAAYKGTIELDPARTPKTFNLKFTAGPEKGNTNFGIYDLNGETWRICLNTRGKDRPKTFATRPGSGYALEILKRGQPVEEQATAPAEVEDTPAGAATELEGEWSMASGITDGHPMDQSLIKIGKRVTRGNETTVSFGPQVYTKARFTIDAAKTPKTIDYIHTQGMHAGKTQQGIYELEERTLKLCVSAPGNARPADFTAKRGDGRTVTVWKVLAK